MRVLSRYEVSMIGIALNDRQIKVYHQVLPFNWGDHYQLVNRASLMSKLTLHHVYPTCVCVCVVLHLFSLISVWEDLCFSRDSFPSRQSLQFWEAASQHQPSSAASSVSVTNLPSPRVSLSLLGKRIHVGSKERLYEAVSMSCSLIRLAFSRKRL